MSADRCTTHHICDCKQAELDAAKGRVAELSEERRLSNVRADLAEDHLKDSDERAEAFKAERDTYRSDCWDAREERDAARLSEQRMRAALEKALRFLDQLRPVWVVDPRLAEEARMSTDDKVLAEPYQIDTTALMAEIDLALKTAAESAATPADAAASDDIVEPLTAVLRGFTRLSEHHKNNHHGPSDMPDDDTVSDGYNALVALVSRLRRKRGDSLTEIIRDMQRLPNDAAASATRDAEQAVIRTSIRRLECENDRALWGDEAEIAEREWWDAVKALDAAKLAAPGGGSE